MTRLKFLEIWRRGTNFQKFVAALGLAGGTATAETPPAMICAGSDPDWSVAVEGDVATFSYIGTSAMEVPQMSRAEGRVWPLAMTLISEDYSTTAILIIDQRRCETGDHSAEVLTQRNEMPVLLVGCCSRQD